MDNVVEVFVNSIQQPQEELLGIVLGVAPELKGALRHHILQINGQRCKQKKKKKKKTERILRWE